MDIENVQNRATLRGVKKTSAKKATLKDRLPLRTLSPNIQTLLTDAIKGRKVLREKRNVVIDSATGNSEASKTAEVSTDTYDYRVCTELEPPKEYWKDLAEKRAVALKNSLNENYELYTENCALKAKLLELESERTYFQLLHSLQ